MNGNKKTNRIKIIETIKFDGKTPTGNGRIYSKQLGEKFLTEIKEKISHNAAFILKDVPDIVDTPDQSSIIETTRLDQIAGVIKSTELVDDHIRIEIEYIDKGFESGHPFLSADIFSIGFINEINGVIYVDENARFINFYFMNSDFIRKNKEECERNEVDDVNQWLPTE